jgi:hypothetical protein
MRFAAPIKAACNIRLKSEVYKAPSTSIATLMRRIKTRFRSRSWHQRTMRGILYKSIAGKQRAESVAKATSWQRSHGARRPRTPRISAPPRPGLAHAIAPQRRKVPAVSFPAKRKPTLKSSSKAMANFYDRIVVKHDA